MKKSITISVAIILAVVVIALYQGIHQHLTAFDTMLFVTMFFIGILAGRSYHESVNESKRIARSSLHKKHSIPMSDNKKKANKAFNEILKDVKRERIGVEL